MPLVFETPEGQKARKIAQDAGASPIDLSDVNQIEAWVDANVKTTADLPLAFKTILKLMAVNHADTQAILKGASAAADVAATNADTPLDSKP